MNRDGALSLEEFCTAMHLVVLRRNEIELPDHLPPALVPYVPLNPGEFRYDEIALYFKFVHRINNNISTHATYRQ